MKRPPLNETNGMIAAVLAFSFVFLFNSYRMGKMSKMTAVSLGAAVLLAAAALALL